MGRLTNADIEPNTLQARAIRLALCAVCKVRVVKGLEGSSVAEPESAEGCEDDEREGVTEDPLLVVSVRIVSGG
jgi:hypothetical protein